MCSRTEIVPNGAAIERTRIISGLSKRDVAEMANIPQSSIVRAERGQGVTAATAAGICRALGKEFDDLFTIHRPGGVAAPAEREEVSA